MPEFNTKRKQLNRLKENNGKADCGKLPVKIHSSASIHDPIPFHSIDSNYKIPLEIVNDLFIECRMQSN